MPNKEDCQLRFIWHLLSLSCRYTFEFLSLYLCFVSSGGVIVYIRYRHVEAIYGNSPRMRTVLRLNTASFIIGVITNLGVSMVGNFQVHVNSLVSPK